MTFPVVQGMSFVTARYRNAAPMIQTSGKDGFKDVGPSVSFGRSTKYRVKDMDGRSWVIYVNPAPGIIYDASRMNRLDSHTLSLPGHFRGTIQVAKNPLGSEGEALYDKAAGTFVVEAQLAGMANDGQGAYSFSYTKIGTAPLLMFLLPHHMDSLCPDLTKNITRLQLRTTTKGTATAI